jgi:hypothetical protein
MSLNKILILIVFILGGITLFIFSNTENAAQDFETMIENDHHQGSHNASSNNKNNNSEIENFAKEIEAAPEIIEAMQPDADFSKIAQIALDQLIHPDSNPMHGLRYRGILWQKPDESLKTIFEKYSTLSSSEQEEQKMKILALASDLCPRSNEADCPTFFMNEAHNSGSSKIQLMAIRGYFKSPLITTDEKMVLVQNFKLNQQDPAILREIEELEKYLSREETKLEDKIQGLNEEGNTHSQEQHQPEKNHEESALGEHL